MLDDLFSYQGADAVRRPGKGLLVEMPTFRIVIQVDDDKINQLMWRI